MPNQASQKMFDSHFHIIDQRFPLVSNNGYTPESFTCENYLDRTNSYERVGGALVSGSFQAFDQTYLLAALKELGSYYVGVIQLDPSVSDDEILKLDNAGVRAVRFNLFRGISKGIDSLENMAKRIHELAGWHVELYLNSTLLSDMMPMLCRLPSISIDHLGVSKEGFGDLLKLVEQGAHVKATGFGRVDFDVAHAIEQISSVNPDALMFGTDLPSTRAPRPFQDDDFKLITDTLGETIANKVLYQNALSFYRF